MLADRLPSRDILHRRAPALAGFAFGALLTLFAGAFITVIYTGHGYSETPVRHTPVYPNL
jgi:hypothetical protein